MKYFFLFFLFVVLFACNEPPQDINSSTPIADTANRSDINVFSDKRQENLWTEQLNFVCGYPSLQYSSLQNSSIYKQWQKKLTSAWNIYLLRDYAVIKKWAQKELNSSYDSVIFYPFGGPDIATAEAMFSKARKIVLVGLENIGYLPDFKKLSQEDIQIYFENLNHSMDLFYKLGYFKTKRLQKDLKKPFINGVINILVFQTGRLGKLIDLQYFTIIRDGQIHFVDSLEIYSKAINGVLLRFKDTKGDLKQVYYLQLNLADENLQNYPEFFCFLNSLGKFSVFLKSASYLLHSSEFSLLRNFVLKYSDFILQDDSGIPYNTLIFNDYKVSFYGHYIKPLNIFKEFYQPDLAEVVNGAKPLPFKFGYNSERGALLLMLAKKQVHTNQYPFYAVQFAMLWNKLPRTDSIFKQLPAVDYYFDDGYYKYTAGHCSDLEGCLPILSQVRSLGYQDAFIVKFYRHRREVVSAN